MNFRSNAPRSTSGSNQSGSKPSLVIELKEEVIIEEGEFRASVGDVTVDKYGKIVLTFLLADGRQIRRRYSNDDSMSGNALRQMIRSLMDTGSGSIDLSELIGAECVIEVVHLEREDGTYFPLVQRVDPVDHDKSIEDSDDTEEADQEHSAGKNLVPTQTKAVKRRIPPLPTRTIDREDPEE